MLYKKSKYKVTAMILVVLFLMLICIFLLQLSLRNRSTISATVVIMVSVIVFAYITFLTIKPQYYQTLEINKRIVFHDRPDSTYLKFSEIDSVTYSGTKFIPMSEMLVIKSKSGTIYVDFNFIHYLDVWKDVVNACVMNNPNILVDEKVRKRLKMV